MTNWRHNHVADAILHLAEHINGSITHTFSVISWKVPTS